MKVFDNKYLRRIVISIQFITMVLLMVMAYNVQFIPMTYLIGIGVAFLVVLIVEYFLIFCNHTNIEFDFELFHDCCFFLCV